MSSCLVVGGGPSGLAAALFLSTRGIWARVVDKKNGLSTFSKALGVNPRTLELLERSGLTEKFLRNGRKMERINVWHNHQVVFRNVLSEVNHRYPFMLIQPQQESERLLAEELGRRGIRVEWGTELEEVYPQDSSVQVRLKNPGGATEEATYEVVIGADGAQSRVRDQLHIPYEGFRYEEAWQLYDIDLETPLAPDEGHILLSEQGGMIMIRLNEQVWRVAGNIPSLLNHLPQGTETGNILWESTFTISHKLAERLEKGNVALIGDAAHLHSPVGARGMNLGIEDAFMLSELITDRRLHEFTQRRHPYLKRTVRRINQMTQTMTGHSYWSRHIRKNISWLSFFFPVLAPSARRFVMGLNP